MYIELFNLDIDIKKEHVMNSVQNTPKKSHFDDADKDRCYSEQKPKLEQQFLDSMVEEKVIQIEENGKKKSFWNVFKDNF